LQGISDIGSGRLFIVKPYGLIGFTHLPPSAAGTGLIPGTTGLYTGGVDVKLGLRSNLVANATVNTDLANADVHTQQFNLTPYPLFFPEKRQFFLENAGVFNFPLGGDSSDLLFFSRQIGIDPITGIEAPVNAGAKITGSLGNFELGVCVTRESCTYLCAYGLLAEHSPRVGIGVRERSGHFWCWTCDGTVRMAACVHRNRAGQPVVASSMDEMDAARPRHGVFRDGGSLFH
jgi:hypothetical protein